MEKDMDMEKDMEKELPRISRRMMVMAKKSKQKFHNELFAALPKLSFIEARRQRWNIYDALYQELYEQGCTRCAGLLKFIKGREEFLVANHVIRRRLCDHMELLLEIFENMKQAEISESMDDCGQLNAMRLWYTNLQLVQRQGIQYDWILQMFFDYVVPDVERLPKENHKFEEIRVRHAYKYAMYLWDKGLDVHVAIKQLTDVLEVCRGQIWTPDDEDRVGATQTMHDAVAIGLVGICMEYVRGHKTTNTEKSLELARRAIVALAEIGIDRHKFVACQAFLMEVDVLVYNRSFVAALKLIRVIYHWLMSDMRREFVELKCDLYKYLGVCYFNKKQIESAIKVLRHSLLICCKYKLVSRQAEVLLEIGRLYSKMPDGRHNAVGALRVSKRIFNELKDQMNEKKADYLLAKHDADHIFPSLLSLLRSREYCRFYDLRQWKMQCTPFWEDDIGYVAPCFGEQLWSGDLPSDVLNIFEGSSKKDDGSSEIFSSGEDIGLSMEGEEEEEEENVNTMKPTTEGNLSKKHFSKISVRPTFNPVDSSELEEESEGQPVDALACLVNEYADEDEKRRALLHE